jgi:hypothetical protein
MLESARKTQELLGMAGVSRQRAADALRRHNWDVLKALAGLIDSGEVTPADLRRDRCPPDLLAAAEARAAAASVATAERDEELAKFAAGGAGRAFPPLARDEDGAWVGKDVFPFWTRSDVAGRKGDRGADDRDAEQKHGIFPVHVNGDEEAEDGVSEGWTEPQRQAYSFLKQHEAVVGRAVLDALFRNYRDEVLPRRADWFPYPLDPDEMERRLPAITSAEDVRRLVSFDGLFVWNRSRDGVAYTGFSFACAWDDEHGAGVVMHGDRVVEIGDAAAAFDESQVDDGHT